MSTRLYEMAEPIANQLDPTSNQLDAAPQVNGEEDSHLSAGTFYIAADPAEDAR